MSGTDSHFVTAILHRVGQGEPAALDELIKVVYPELRRLAANRLRRERRNHTLSPTSLINELYLRLFSGTTISWQNRAHFFAVAAKQMRFILVDYARRRQGGETVSLTADDAGDLNPQLQLRANSELLNLHEALDRLAVIRPRAAAGVEMRYFGGLKQDEIAAIQGIDDATVRRDWALAKSWLYTQLNSS